MTKQATEKKLSVLETVRRNAVMNSVNRKASDFYGEPLTVTQILVDKEEREISIGQTGHKAKTFKVAFKTVEQGWIDTYTLACKAFAEMLYASFQEAGLDVEVGDEFPEPLQVVFFEQLTRRHKEENGGDGRATDSVRLHG